MRFLTHLTGALLAKLVWNNGALSGPAMVISQSPLTRLCWLLCVSASDGPFRAMRIYLGVFATKLARKAILGFRIKILGAVYFFQQH